MSTESEELPEGAHEPSPTQLVYGALATAGAHLQLASTHFIKSADANGMADVRDLVDAATALLQAGHSLVEAAAKGLMIPLPETPTPDESTTQPEA